MHMRIFLAADTGAVQCQGAAAAAHAESGLGGSRDALRMGISIFA